MKKITLTLLLFSLSFYSQENKNFLMSAKDIIETSYNDITFFEILQPGKEFKLIKKLGKPLSIKSSRDLLTKTTEIVYDGFKLIYLNAYGEPELQHFIIEDISKLKIKHKGKLQTKYSLAKKIKTKSKKEKINGRLFDKSDKKIDKFGDLSNYIELQLNKTGDKVERIVIRNIVVN